MKNLLTGAMIASLIASVALNIAQYNGALAAPENLTFQISMPSDDPIVMAAEAYGRGE